ncbi:MAG TPA: hypothetical protein VKU40_04350 [Thermoanaerobaculia bacterium]|nr:hypothetical protein [Thermoanaerobaculia bacterium]
MADRKFSPSQPIKVSLPARIAYDLDAFQKVTARLAEELGCTRCISGADCTFGLETDWVVNPAGELLSRGIQGPRG